MRRSTQILLVGLGLSLLIGGWAYLLERHKDNVLAAAVERCHSEDKANRTKADQDLKARGKQNSNPYDDLPEDAMVCLPSDLQSLPGLTGLQAEIVAANAASFNSEPWIYRACLLFAISAIPWTWYFLLRRIAELRSAISGKPPIG